MQLVSGCWYRVPDLAKGVYEAHYDAASERWCLVRPDSGETVYEVADDGYLYHPGSRPGYDLPAWYLEVDDLVPTSWGVEAIHQAELIVRNGLDIPF
jgi:hypothetical protein